MSESKKPRATIDQAKAAWEAQADPTIRGTCKALDKAGLFCSVATLQRWHKAGWELKSKTYNAAKDQATVEAVIDGVKRQDNKVLTRQEKFEQFEKSLDDLCVVLLDDEMKPKLAERAVQERHVASILLAKAVQKRAAFIVEAHSPEKVAKLLEALQRAGTITNEIPIEAPEDGSGAKVIEGRVIEPSATQLAIEAFQARRRQEVAA